MDLEFWRNTYSLTMKLVNIALYVNVGYASFLFPKIKNQYKYIYFYILGSMLFELVSLSVMQMDETSSYFKYVDYFFGLFETTFLYLFIIKSFPHSKVLRIAIALNSTLIALFFIFYFISNSSAEAESFNAFLSLIHLFLILIALFESSLMNPSKRFFRSPVNIILVSFLVAYSMLIAVFFLIQDIIEYSRIIANQVYILKHSIGILFYFLISYGLKKSISKT